MIVNITAKLASPHRKSCVAGSTVLQPETIYPAEILRSFESHCLGLNLSVPVCTIVRADMASVLHSATGRDRKVH